MLLQIYDITSTNYGGGMVVYKPDSKHCSVFSTEKALRRSIDLCIKEKHIYFTPTLNTPLLASFDYDGVTIPSLPELFI